MSLQRAPHLPFVSRRGCLAAAGAALLSAVARPAGAQRPATNRLAVGVQSALVASGLADRLGAALARDTGLVIEWQGGPSGALLPTLERGELDAALVFEPQLERELLAQNLVHDRRPVARTELVLVGPAPRRTTRRGPTAPGGDPAGVAGGPRHDVQAALERIATAGARGDASFVASGEPSATRALERDAWRPLAPAASAPWWRTAGPGAAAALELARASGAYALVERGVWQALGGSGLALLVEGDPRLALDYHVMRAFRAPHPAGRLMVSWLAGPTGQQAVASFGRGYRPV